MTAPGRALKFVLLAFVAVSIGAAVYKVVGPPCGCADGAAAEPVPAVAVAEPKPAAPPVKKQTAAKTATVYYFYTNARCSSCTTIEAYTREAVEQKFSAGYKGWTVAFKGVNIDEKANEHFVQDYWLNSKAVIVQKFSGDKPLNWGKLDKVWTLTGDKDAFLAYIAEETGKLLDQK